jgi:hypothetical protein
LRQDRFVDEAGAGRAAAPAQRHQMDTTGSVGIPAGSVLFFYNTFSPRSADGAVLNADAGSLQAA